MTAQKKAKELFDKMHNIPDGGFGSMGVYEAKECALIAVNEIMTALTVMPYGMQYLSAIDYWVGIKQEIEKL